MAETIDSLFVSLGIESDKKSFDKANNLIKETANNAMQVIASVGAAAGTSLFTKNMAESIQKVNDLSKSLYVARNDVLRLKYAMEQAGGTPDGMDALLKKAAGWKIHAKYDEFDEKAYLNGVGFNPHILKDFEADEIIKIIADFYSKMNREGRQNFKAGMGITDEEEKLFSKGRPWIDSQYIEFDKRNIGISDELVAAAEEFNTNLTNLKTNFESISYSIANDLIPATNKWLEKIDSFLTEHKDTVEYVVDGGWSDDFFRHAEVNGMKFRNWLRDNFGTSYLGDYEDPNNPISFPYKNQKKNNHGLSGGLNNLSTLPSVDGLKQAQEEAKLLQTNVATAKQASADLLPPGSNLVNDKSSFYKKLLADSKNENVAAFLGGIRFFESGGYPDGGYNTWYGGLQFNNLLGHPGYQDRKIKVPGYAPFYPSAAGAYQITEPTYKRLAEKYGITGFTKDDQDVLAVALLLEMGLLQAAIYGDFDKILSSEKFSKVWASVPFSKAGQNPKSLSEWKKVINKPLNKPLNQSPVSKGYDLSSFNPNGNIISTSSSNQSSTVNSTFNVTINTDSDKVEDTRRVVKETLTEMVNNAKMAPGKKWQ